MLILATHDELTFQFPEVHQSAWLTVQLQRTLRVPDDGREYPLPAGLGCLPLHHVEDFRESVPASWLNRGGIMVPMHQSEAIWMNFTSTHIQARGSAYPFAIKVGTGKINAVTGNSWSPLLARQPQDYVVAPKQKWLDGYSVGKNAVRQFVAMPLGSGYTTEEQLNKSAEWGGIQIQVYPMKGGVFDERFPRKEPREPLSRGCSSPAEGSVPLRKFFETSPAMGIAPGGLIKQQIFEDEFNLSDWDQSHTSRCFIHLCNSGQWRSLTGESPTQNPVSAEEYSKAGIPWFDYYQEHTPSIEGSEKLTELKSVFDHARTTSDFENAIDVSHMPKNVIDLSGKPVSDKAW